MQNLKKRINPSIVHQITVILTEHYTLFVCVNGVLKEIGWVRNYSMHILFIILLSWNWDDETHKCCNWHHSRSSLLQQVKSNWWLSFLVLSIGFYEQLSSVGAWSCNFPVLSRFYSLTNFSELHAFDYLVSNFPGHKFTLYWH